MTHTTLIAIDHNFGKIDEVIVPGHVGNGYIEQRYALADFDAAYAESLKGDWRTRIDLAQLRVHIEGNDADKWSYASAKSRWNEKEGRYMVTAIYNSHGGYNYAEVAA